MAQKMLEFEDLREVEAAHLPERDRQLAVAAVRDELSLTVVEPVGTVSRGWGWTFRYADWEFAGLTGRRNRH